MCSTPPGMQNFPPNGWQFIIGTHPTGMLTWLYYAIKSNQNYCCCCLFQWIPQRFTILGSETHNFLHQVNDFFIKIQTSLKQKFLNCVYFTLFVAQSEIIPSSICQKVLPKGEGHICYWLGSESGTWVWGSSAVWTWWGQPLSHLRSPWQHACGWVTQREGRDSGLDRTQGILLIVAVVEW